MTIRSSLAGKIKVQMAKPAELFSLIGGFTCVVTFVPGRQNCGYFAKIVTFSATLSIDG